MTDLLSVASLPLHCILQTVPGRRNELSRSLENHVVEGHASSNDQKRTTLRNSFGKPKVGTPWIGPYHLRRTSHEVVFGDLVATSHAASCCSRRPSFDQNRSRGPSIGHDVCLSFFLYLETSFGIHASCVSFFGSSNPRHGEFNSTERQQVAESSETVDTVRYPIEGPRRPTQARPALAAEVVSTAPEEANLRHVDS